MIAPRKPRVWRQKIGTVLLGSALASAAMPTGAPAEPRGRAVRVNTSGQTLAAVLLDVARQSGIDLVLAGPTARTMQAPKIHGRYTLDEALSMLLSGSGLTYRRSQDGTYVVSTLARAPVETEAPAVPEILVIGKRTQNSDIRRSENDIQPYKVWTSEDVTQSHSSDVDSFLRNRVTSNGQIGSAAQAAIGNNASEVNLRGLGSGQTLVLVDGRRLPGAPSPASYIVGVLQPDLNGIPLGAIERIEVLNSTAGGIYGPGATAGVVNVVLKRDYHGADLALTYGLSDRGDAASRRLDARIGFSPDDGRTQVMVAGSRTWGADLRRGDRDFTTTARRLQQLRDPAGYAANPPISGSVNISSLNGQTLTLDPAYGGGSLGASSTSVPATYAGVAADGGALYRANAGHLDGSLSTDDDGAGRSLLTRARLGSLLANVRHRFSDRLEAYVDLLIVENAGRAVAPREVHVLEVDVNPRTNPFQQDVLVSFPLPGYTSVVDSRTRTGRLTGGLILNLPHTWKMNADYSIARTTTKMLSTGTGLDNDYFAAAAQGGYSTTPSGPPINLLAGQSMLLATLTPFIKDDLIQETRRNDFGDFTLRLAGPIITLPGGPLSLSVLGEDRHEHVPASTLTISTDTDPTVVPAIGIRARSIYAELRAPLTDRISGPAGLRGLEFQLAVRHDATRSILPENLEEVSGPTLNYKASATVYTAGARFLPFNGVMIRASMASGFLPPTIDQLSAHAISFTSSPTLLSQSSLPEVLLIAPTSLRGPADALRAGNRIGSEAVFTVLSAGSTHLQPELARSFSAGIVLSPVAIERLRLSIDYTRIDKRHEIVSFHDGDQAYFLANESQFPGRVIRAPLTDADRARGYSAGVVTAIDTSSFNVGRTIVEAVDMQLDYRLPTEAMGDFSLHAAGTWQPRLTRQNDPQSAAVNSAGYADGPLTWRANGGVNWQRGPFGLGVLATYFGSYRVANSSDSAAVATQTSVLQGGSRIPAQLYVDFSASRHIALPRRLAGVHSLDVRFGIENLFDHRPPIVVDPYSANYSLYGDPRLRRFELSIEGHL